MDSQAALQRFLLENNAQDMEIYQHDEQAIFKLLHTELNAVKRPWFWKTNPNYFKKVMLSSVALIKMAMHAKAGGDIEVMGNLLGYPQGDTMWIMDVYALPCEASETRVNAAEGSEQF